ncbi:FtsQ-type POTRA domain-containing protein [Clostridium algidicarnis]|uniref:cell division protein FtsQ/DivIB n=1 Tax=Clostridium algidicarnis TaxID=37659 RepID=UPI001C0E6F35|nr:FtsQ-type POTRA domain-containing protein [Clostridium algidicarnis]MBU3195500.1 FtsQ-type POTRA domain-containing protein [Clostridium algidicarnis]
MGEIVKKKEENSFIVKRRKRKALKRNIIIFMFLIVILITLSLKLKVFDIETIIVEGNNIISSEEIISTSTLEKGNNIFYINTKKIIKKIHDNPYIKNVKISRRLPNTIILNVEERSAFFYGESNNKYFIIDRDSKLLQIKDEITNMNLIYIDGLDYTNAKVGEKMLPKEDRKNKVISDFSFLIENNTSGIDITSLDMKDILSIKAYHNNMCIIIGTSDDIEGKLNKAINIISSKPQLSQSKGYINVSFKGNPVIFVEE